VFRSTLLGVLLLIAGALFGIKVNGARRWLSLGFMRIQPSELLKIAVPLMLAWYFHKHEGHAQGASLRSSPACCCCCPSR
jgi:rod shape determining protein RodA